MALHGHVAGLCALADREWRAKLWTIGLWLFVPCLGWPAVLGYRTRFVRHLFGEHAQTLPPTRGAFWGCAWDGLRAVGVIFGYLAPLYAILFALLLMRGWVPGGTALGLTAFFVAFPIFSTLSIPISCLLFAAARPAWLSPLEASLFLAGYALLIFVVPAGFLEVTRSGRYRSAFALWRSLPFLVRNLADYVEAWLKSGLMACLGHSVPPLAPWGVAWCYLSIIVNFNEILLRSQRTLPSPGFDRLLADPRFRGRGRFGRARANDANDEAVPILDLRLFSVPLPRWPRQRRESVRRESET